MIIRGKYALQELEENFPLVPVVFEEDSRIILPLSFPVIISALAYACSFGKRAEHRERKHNL